jgi:Flp pilus assembly protein TadG
MLSLIRRFARSRRGSVAVITAICAPALIVIIGAATDYVMMTHIKGSCRQPMLQQLAGVKD